MDHTPWKAYQKATMVALVAVYMVILAGAVVRTTGSGMGCPDWPRCFGQWVPPTDVSQLPADYKERYKPVGHEIADFNAAKTWTEYVNRLVGVLAGFAVAWMTLMAFRLRKETLQPVLLSAAILVLMGFQAWLGKKVVDTNLKENMITIHMVAAIVIMFMLLMALRVRIAKTQVALPSSLHRIQMVLILLGLVQLVLGSQVREQIDALAVQTGEAGRTGWIERLDVLFYIHRSLSLLLLGIMLWMLFQLHKLRRVLLSVYKLYLVSFGLLCLMLASGIALAYMGMPAWAQPIHLLCSTLLLSSFFIAYLQLRPATQPLGFNPNLQTL